MSFDVYLIPSSATPGGREARAATERALTACGARWGGSDEADVILSTGEEVEFYGATEQSAGAMFALRDGLSPGLALVIFQVAEATACFVTAPLEQLRLFRTPGNAGRISAEDAEEIGTEVIVDIAAAGDLIGLLAGGLQAWADFAAEDGDDDDPEDDLDEDDPVIDPTLLDRFFNRPKSGS